MKTHVLGGAVSIAALLTLGASGGVQAQTEGAAEPFALTGSCLEQTQQLADMVARDLVDVTDVSASDGAGTGGEWALPSASSDASEAASATDAAMPAQSEQASLAPAGEAAEGGVAAPEGDAALAASTTTSTAQEPTESEPLLLTMADGSTVNLGGETEEALKEVPKDNWFGQSPDVETARSYLDSAAELAEAGDEEACLASLDDAMVALGMPGAGQPANQ